MFSTQNLDGKLFIKTTNGEIIPGATFLKNILSKYENVPFTEEINSSFILKIDCFLDSILLETQNFFLIEKMLQASSSKIPESYNLFNNLFEKEDFLMDYWYDENSERVLSCFLKKYNNKFSLLIRESSLITGQTNTILEEILDIVDFPDSWVWADILLKSVKITHNLDTKMYNISFLVRNLENWGIMSIFLYEDPALKIKESKGVFLT